eukprot:TRINITY_DN9862_c0_g2_i1.p2 TRINITY_DN9862_c0_g2~~TRINITY_DN9862_c0_g2_i1.p2  ORF type:complete len:212 (+),score=10.48 TRINITY_DN9862_c0_g2_i1:726-1361(+)
MQLSSKDRRRRKRRERAKGQNPPRKRMVRGQNPQKKDPNNLTLIKFHQTTIFTHYVAKFKRQKAQEEKGKGEGVKPPKKKDPNNFTLIIFHKTNIFTPNAPHEMKFTCNTGLSHFYHQRQEHILIAFNGEREVKAEAERERVKETSLQPQFKGKNEGKSASGLIGGRITGIQGRVGATLYQGQETGRCKKPITLVATKKGEKRGKAYYVQR